MLLDGLADRQHPELGGLTPLEAAWTPNLDLLAAEGVNGFHYPLAPGLAPSSFQAHFALFGYPAEDFPGRGVLEAMGEGVELAEGEVALRANFLTVAEDDGRFEVTERPDPREGDDLFEGVELDDVIDGVVVRFVYTGAWQGIVVLTPQPDAVTGREPSLSRHVTDADPFEVGFPVIAVQPLDEADDPTAAARTARVLNEWMLRSKARLEDGAATGRRLPANFVTVKWSGSQRVQQPFEKRWGLRGATVASGPLYGGIGKAVGLDQVDPGFLGGQPREDLEQRLRVAEELFDEGYEFVHVHSKVPDSAGHRKRPKHKAQRIELLDQALNDLTRRRAWDREDTVVAVTGDHATPSSGPLYHSGEGVPLLIAGGASGRDTVGTFGESASRKGLLGQLRGIDLMPVLLMAADRSAFLAERFTADMRYGRLDPDDLVPLNRQSGTKAKEA